jgi:formate hydrogenlyase subunit 3/multisubunit Na+/H+ antiporter MnhD subunit
LFLPIVFGPIAIVLAIIAKNKKEKLSTIALVIGIVGTVIGMIIGAIVGASMFS